MAENEEQLVINIQNFVSENYKYDCNKFKKKIGFSDSGKGAKTIADIIIKKIEE